MTAPPLLDESSDGGHIQTTTVAPPTRQPTHPSPGNAPGISSPDKGSPDNKPSSRGNSSSNAGRLARGFRKALRKNQDYVRITAPESRGNHDYIRITVPESRCNRLPAEWWKTGIAFIYAGFNLVLTTVMITVVHERVPDKSVSPPLPDKFFDYVPRVEWAFSVTEANGIILMTLWFTQWLFLKYKAIVGRRFFFIVGTLYLYRIVTMYITTLPVPGNHMTCAPKLYGNSEGKVYRILQMVSGGGLSLASSQLMCGDYLYSGHTVMLTLIFLFIREYSPCSLWWYHLLCWLLSAVGIVCILVAHDHYSIDVVVAYFITSRTFYWYHTMANNQALRGSPNNYLSRTWWNPVFLFLERNVQAVVPCTFSWPLPLPLGTFKNPCERYSMVQAGTD